MINHKKVFVEKCDVPSLNLERESPKKRNELPMQYLYVMVHYHETFEIKLHGTRSTPGSNIRKFQFGDEEYL